MLPSGTKNKRPSLIQGMMFAVSAIAVLTAGCSSAAAEPFAYISNADSRNISVVDTSNDSPATTLAGEWPNYGVVVTPDAKRIYVTNYQRTVVSVINGLTNTMTTPVEIGNSTYWAAATPNGKRVYVTDYLLPSVSVIDVASNSALPKVVLPSPGGGVAVSPDSRRIYVPHYSTNTVSEIDAGTNAVSATINTHGDYSHSIAVSPDGRQAYVTNVSSNDVSVLDLESKDWITNIHVGAYPFAVAFSPDGARAYVSNYNSGSVSVIDTGAKSVVATIWVGDAPRGVAVTPDGRKLYVTRQHSNNVAVIDTSLNEVINYVGVGAFPIQIGIVPPPTGMQFHEFALNAKIAAPSKRTSFQLNSKFTLSSFGDGVQPLTEPLRLLVGPYIVTVPAGSFKINGPNYAYDGVIDGVRLNAKLIAYDSLHYALNVHATGVDLTGATNPVPVSFSIGDDMGQTTASIPGKAY